MKNLTFTILLIIICRLAVSQDTEIISPYVNLQYFKNSGDSSYLRTTLTYSRNRMEIPIEGVKLTFRSGGSDGNILKEVLTDSKGLATCYLESSNIKPDGQGLWPFTVTFEGNDTIEASSAELLIRSATLLMECLQDDSLKTVSLKVEKFDNGKMVPAAGEILNVYVPRMFSMLPIGEITLDEAGTGSIEFPSDLPGDLEGNLYVVARFEEHPEFGNIEKKELQQWGIPYIATSHTSKRALWTKTAPKWMIYTLTILLLGVWSHYLYALISLIRIKVDSGRNNASENKSQDYFIK